MSVAPNAGVVALDNFKEPTGSLDGLQGQVPKPLAGQQDYVLLASGWSPGGAIPGLGTMASQDADNVAITGGSISNTTLSGTTVDGANPYVNFTPTAAPVYQEGRVFYDSTAHTLNYYNDNSQMSVNIGQENIVRVRNRTGVAIANGSVVYVNGATGNTPTVALALATSFSTSDIIGVATTDIADNGFGYVTTIGVVNGLDTSAFTEGQAVFLSAITAGTFTATEPTTPNYSVQIGVILRANPSIGTLLVAVQLVSVETQHIIGNLPSSQVSGLGSIAAQNANNVAITGGTIDGTTVGVTTPATGTFTTLIGGAGSANYGQLTGGATTKAVEFKTLGTDTNISLVFGSKGTGAIDLAAGSQGINISNGGTVTAITGVAGGSYTTIPTITIAPPTTAGGVQATGTVAMGQLTTTLAGGGTGYAVNNVLTAVGGTFSTAISITVTAVSAGVITAFTVANSGVYTVLPTNPISVTGGTGTGATFNVTAWQVRTANFTITNAGSGYVEQPTVTFSSGSAAAYASVGSGTIIKGLGSSTVSGTTSASIIFQTPNNLIPALVLRDTPTASDTFVAITSNVGYANIFAQGTTNGILKIGANGTGSVYLNTNGGSETNQMRVSHTASAVNYVNVTGAATTAIPVISAAGSDTNVSLSLSSKGTGVVGLFANGAKQLEAFGPASAVNYVQISGATTGTTPVVGALGTDTNVGLFLATKGTGVVQFGTYAASVLAVTGYVTIKDAGGTTRRLLVG